MSWAIGASCAGMVLWEGKPTFVYCKVSDNTESHYSRRIMRQKRTNDWKHETDFNRESLPTWTISTPWLAFAGPGNWFKCRSITILGKRLGPFGLKLDIYQNYNETIQETKTWPVQEIEQSGFLRGTRFQARKFLMSNKIEAIKATITVTPFQGEAIFNTTWGSIELQSLEFEVGVRSGEAHRLGPMKKAPGG